MVADAGTDIFHSCGIGPISKWVDDHIFFRVLQVHLFKYNALRREWRQDIQAHRGHRQSGSQLWYGGKDLPEGSQEEFDEDCSSSLLDVAGDSSQSAEDHILPYAEANINKLSAHLGI